MKAIGKLQTYLLRLSLSLLKRPSFKVTPAPLQPATCLFVKVDTEVYFAILAPF